MAQQGRGGVALGVAAIGSFVAGTVGVVALTLFAPVLADQALRFGPPEYFALMVLAFTAVVSLSGASLSRGIAMALCRLSPRAGRARPRHRPAALHVRLREPLRRRRPDRAHRRPVRDLGGLPRDRGVARRDRREDRQHLPEPRRAPAEPARDPARHRDRLLPRAAAGVRAERHGVRRLRRREEDRAAARALRPGRHRGRGRARGGQQRDQLGRLHPADGARASPRRRRWRCCSAGSPSTG